MNKTLNLNASVYDLCTLHPELKNLMKDIGFDHISKPGMLETAGRIMTIPKGARLKQIDLAHVLDALREHGFEPVFGEETNNERNH
ncbi:MULTISPECIES: DUF1858 domain-containing protein [Bacillus]|uniref:DUF1858 domain-containing protein n=1 Tax=Bacillus glycinifermentans TaxID=1664069 RepID=A0AAJ4D2L7_9BACI|nr:MULTISPECIES: DUF1858 domain-containing protein [Bacillus]KKB73098.1 hypothetical protein TH62_13595 [Bacillus sp. TH008]MBU8785179.1 DUF1858 domain-containing protein [Bacillus glycinifermentans]MDU0071372.1 DUF1858 domain-containing protein [Bacillus sp. IG6]MED8019327.1 DUF1858 domain-containing protein [Bacillus glycinifermentans]NUJ15349.1 DUF1858 domain-containing protein [Bacillus glycinifermentans]